jgi:hypothetical protein
VRDLGTSFCKLNPDAFTNEKLSFKPTKKEKGVVGRPRKLKKSDVGPSSNQKLGSPKDGLEDASKAKKSKN